jgi:lipopolysaccharide export system permease protein
MFRILDRYIFREVAGAWLGVTAVLLFIMLTNQFAQVLGEVVKGNLPKDAVFQVIGLTGLQYLTVLVPIALFLAIMLALGRLYRDSEFPAMMACRIGPGGIYRPLTWLVLPICVLIAWVAVDLGPRAMATVERISVEARRQADLTSVEAGKFTVGGDGRSVVYVEQVRANGQLAKVFLERRAESGMIEAVIADRGAQVASADQDSRFIVLYDGRRYDGIPGTSEFRVVEFSEHGIPYRLPEATQAQLKPPAMPFLSLLRMGDPKSIAELQWRVSVPITTFILALLAVPLSRSQPRQGRYGKIMIGLLVFIIYFNLLGASKAWMEQGVLPGAIGLWWVHGSMLGLAMLLLALQNNIFRRLFPSGGK